MTARERLAVAVCFVLLTVGTIVVLFRQEDQRDEDRRLNVKTEEAIRQECEYAKENREIIVTTLTNLSMLVDPAVQALLVEQAMAVQRRVDELKC